MYFALRPARSIEAFGLERNQLGLLFRLEDLQGHSSSCSVDAAASDFATPDQSATRYVVEINKSLPFKEALPYIGHTVFNHRLILGMGWPRRIGQKAPVVGILQEGPVEARGVGISLLDTSFHSVNDDTPRTTTKKHPGAFEAIDDRGKILLESRDHAAEPAFKQDLPTVIDCLDRKSTRLNSSHTVISYAVFCLKKKKTG